MLGPGIRGISEDWFAAREQQGGVADVKDQTMAGTDEQAQQADDLPWRLALRVHHPSADLSDVVKRVGEAFGVEARWLWRAGDVDPHAKPAGQLKPTSYCLVDWLDTEGTIATALADATEAVSGLREEFRAIHASGGRLDFFVGLFVDSMMGFVLPPGLLARLGEAGIALEFDIYGPLSKG